MGCWVSVRVRVRVVPKLQQRYTDIVSRTWVRVRVRVRVRVALT